MKNKSSISVISMKKFLIGIVLVLNIIFTSCSRQAIVREFGGSMQVELPAGEELMEATWKNNSLFYTQRIFRYIQYLHTINPHLLLNR